MGNEHNYYYPSDDFSQSFSEKHESKTDMHCPWTFAATMTVGSITVPDIQANIAINNVYLTESEDLWLTNPLALPNPRGPPAS